MKISGNALILATMSLLGSLPRSLFPTSYCGTRWLRQMLRDAGVKAPLSPGCLDELVMEAAKAAETARSADETYAAALRKQLQARARFVHRWTTTDDAITDPEWVAWIPLARKYLLPRAWSIVQPKVTESRRDISFAVPDRLVVKSSRSHGARQLYAVNDELPGNDIMSDLQQADIKRADLKRVGDKS